MLGLSLKKEDAQSMLREWRDQINEGRPKQKRPLVSRQQLKAMGIKFVIEPPPVKKEEQEDVSNG